jgi:serine/threonine-protein kinase
MAATVRRTELGHLNPRIQERGMPENTSCQSCGKPVDPPDRLCPSCEPTQTDPPPAHEESATERQTTERLVEATKGEFKILRQVGHGAMGSVYLARDIALSRRVAIKVISPHLLQDEKMVSRFLLEAKTVAALNHPHIVTLHAVRHLGGLYYFVMDFIDGPSLRYVMEKKGPLDLPLVQALLYQVGGALTYAHRRGVGVIHRDVKPANIMIDREGNAVVTDFGIAKIGAEQTGLTQAGSTIGTPSYMSPEQCRGKDLTGASDQYALGIVAYEMLAGVLPFEGDMMAVMMAHAQDEPPPLREHRPDCPPMVEAAIFRMLAKVPEDRFPHVAAAVAALWGRPFEHDDPIRAATVSLVRSVSGQEAGLDDDSPLSPLPGAAQALDSAPAPAAETLVLPPREGVSEPAAAAPPDAVLPEATPADAALPGPPAAAPPEPPPTPSEDEVREVEGMRLVSLVEETSTQGVLESEPGSASRSASDATPPDDAEPPAPASDPAPATSPGDDAQGASAASEQAPAPPPAPVTYPTEWVETQLKKDKPRRLRWGLWLAAIVVLAVGVAPPVRALWTPLVFGVSTPTGSGASIGLAEVLDTLETGDELKLNATILMGGAFLPDTAARWESGDPAVATVDRAGLVRARGAGVTQITVLFQDASASVEVVVRGGG